jgi:hypothetical protein
VGGSIKPPTVGRNRHLGIVAARHEKRRASLGKPAFSERKIK